MSGEWVGYFSHRAPASEGGGAAMQFASMQIELSDDGDAILGSGADGLGSFELQRGRRAVDVTPHSVEFSKVYTAVQAGYAPMGDAADGAAVEVFCEGTVEPRTSCIRGEWHMAFRFSGKAYREMDRGPQRSGGGECPAASTSTTTTSSTPLTSASSSSTGLGDSFKNKPEYKEGDELFWCGYDVVEYNASRDPISHTPHSPHLQVRRAGDAAPAVGGAAPREAAGALGVAPQADRGGRRRDASRTQGAVPSSLSHLSPPRSSLYRSTSS